MKYFLSILILFGTLHSLVAQKYFTRTGEITFTSEAPLEKIEAKNLKATSVFDMESGQIEWAVLIKAFQFEKALMEEHFNENYMESSQYPKAIFKGTMTNLSQIDLMADGNYTVDITGDLEIHGVTQPVSTTATLMVENGQVSGHSELTLKVADYDIKIPKLVKDNIAKEVLVTIRANYELLNAKS